MPKPSPRVALVTGATSGIGLAAARLLAARDWTVVATGRNRDVLAELEGEGTAAATLPGDLAEEGVADQVAAGALEVAGRLDGLVHAAGILAAGGMDDEDDGGFLKLMEVNLTASWRILKRCWEPLKRTAGNAVLVSSVTGLRAFPGLVGYCVSKAAVDQLVRTAALDGAPYGVRVNGVNPGVVVTELHKRGGMGEEAYEAFLERSKQSHPLGRVGRPEEVAEAIAWLLDDATSGWITGESLPVDGGRHQTAAR
jgi:NAD(P)-dependent dehydrogenase (short-subunit alcohol dehydrogenase family)